MKKNTRSNVVGWVQAVDLAETRDVNGEQRSLRLAGYAALFNNPSERMGRIVETIDPRAFDKVLADDPDVRFQVEHAGLALARTANKTLRLRVDERGLYFEADLNPNVQAARDLYALVERGDVTQMSFGFTIGDEEVDDRGDTVRAHITRVDMLYELSSVSFPAYRDTLVVVVEDDEDDHYGELSELGSIEDVDDLEEAAARMWEIDVAAARREREAAE